MPSNLFEIIDNMNIEDYSETELRVSERLGIPMISLKKDLETGKYELIQHPKYNEYMTEYYKQKGIKINPQHKKLTEGFIKAPTRDIAIGGSTMLPTTRSNYTISDARQSNAMSPSSVQNENSRLTVTLRYFDVRHRQAYKMKIRDC